jgi:hypothetical protein
LGVTAAAAEERLGAAEAPATRRAVFDLVAASAPDAEAQFDLLKWAGGLDQAPLLAADLAAAIGPLAVRDPRKRDREVARLLGLAADEEGIRVLIDGLPPNDRFDLVLEAASAFMAEGDFATGFALGALITDGPIKERLAVRAINALVADENLSGAEAVAALIDDPGERAENYAYLARLQAEDRNAAAAQRLAAMAGALAPSSDDQSLPLRLAEALLMIGERDQAMAMLTGLPQDDWVQREVIGFTATAALFDGDLDGFLRIVNRDEDLGQLRLYGALYLWLQSGDRDMAPVLTRLTPDQTVVALNAWLDVLRDDENWQGMAEVLDRHVGAVTHFDRARAALALHQAREGDISGGLAIAAAQGDPVVLADIAALLPE